MIPKLIDANIAVFSTGSRYASKKMRSSVFSFKESKCRKCGVDAHSLFLRINSLEEPGERLNVLCDDNCRLPLGRICYDRFLRSQKER